MRIIGVDPGLQLTGYGVIDWHASQPRLVDGGVIRLNARLSIPDRLVELERELDAMLAEFKPEIVAVEEVYSHYAHPRTAILMGHARGVILLVARRRGLRIEALAANRVKESVTGNGHASKVQVQRAIQHQWNLPQPPEPADVADALAVALCCGSMLSAAAHVPAPPKRRRHDKGLAALAERQISRQDAGRLSPARAGGRDKAASRA